MLAKGLKGSEYKDPIEPVRKFYHEIYNSTRHLAQLTIKEKSFDSMNLVLSSFRPGFLSKYIEISKITCDVFSKIALAF